ncbi:TadE/TadG family type IV pilus assembly protein [Sphingomicrobium flavum]|uniref:TadE/TadG family type IV pilus assembly protein n=1 Tax=Sphingomicrobium flavum TaxID=1229164 RepID=UPI00289FD784|nr:TadE/TadG family type IV pilus assembly protein [Sphingomicrobium flavum]
MMRGVLRNRDGAAAAEMALVTPLLVLLLAGGVETGYYFYTQNRLVESVRDAARFASRQDFAAFSPCPTSGSTTLASTNNLHLQARQLARKGTIDLTETGEAGDRIWGWAEDGETFTVSYTCATSVDDGAGGNVVMGGIYTSQVSGAPVVTVAASLPHRPVFAFAGFTPGLRINASQQSAVAGI